MKRTRSSNLNIGAKKRLRSREVANYSPRRGTSTSPPLARCEGVRSVSATENELFSRWLGEEPDPRDLMQPRPPDLMRRRSFNSRINRPNGLAFSPDESKLYVVESNLPRKIHVFDVTDNGTKLANKRPLHRSRPGHARRLPRRRRRQGSTSPSWLRSGRNRSTSDRFRRGRRRS
jgi:hypothetical protein